MKVACPIASPPRETAIEIITVIAFSDTSISALSFLRKKSRSSDHYILPCGESAGN
jgi:hypothetical protein